MRRCRLNSSAKIVYEGEAVININGDKYNCDVCVYDKNQLVRDISSFVESRGIGSAATEIRDEDNTFVGHVITPVGEFDIIRMYGPINDTYSGVYESDPLHLNVEFMESTEEELTSYMQSLGYKINDPLYLRFYMERVGLNYNVTSWQTGIPVFWFDENSLTPIKELKKRTRVTKSNKTREFSAFVKNNSPQEVTTYLEENGYIDAVMEGVEEVLDYEYGVYLDAERSNYIEAYQDDERIARWLRTVEGTAIAKALIKANMDIHDAQTIMIDWAINKCKL